MMSEQELREAYGAASQGHVFAHWHALTGEQREELLAQLRSISPTHVNQLFAELKATPAVTVCDLLPAVPDASVEGAAAETRAAWRAAGLQAVREGKLAVVLLAGAPGWLWRRHRLQEEPPLTRESRLLHAAILGGQGTRLGSPDPKGMYDIGLPSHRSLFQLQAERILALQRLAGTPADAEGGIPWYIMTSAATRGATQQFFGAHSNWGIRAGDIQFFDQGCLPCLDPATGAMLMATPHQVATAPDGNGGLYPALRTSGALADMRRRGIESVYVYCVDNALVAVGDPDLVGFCRLRGAAAGAKVVSKAQPREPVGVFCRDGATHALRVVEYSELPPDVADAGTFNAANIALHYFSLPFLTTCCGDVAAAADGSPHVAAVLKHHAALKKVTCLPLDPSAPSTMVPAVPERPNALKLEAFIFDVYPLAPPAGVALLQGVRSDDFAPVKNAPGSAADSPDTARELVCAQARRWAQAAGVQVAGAGLFEVSPLVSYAGEGLERACGQTWQTPCCVEPHML